MAKPRSVTVPDCITAQPWSAQRVPRRVRSVIRKALSGAVIFFAAWNERCAIHPATPGVAEMFQQALAPDKVTKGIIQLPFSKPVPVTLIERIAEFRARALTRRAEAL